MDEAAARDRAARPGAGAVPGRHLRRRRDRPRRRAAETADHQLRALPPGRLRARPAERRAHPRRGDRPRPRRGGRVPGARGQPAQPVGRLVRDGEPPHDGARLPRPVHPPAGAHGRRLRNAPPAGPAGRRRPERGRPDRRRAHPRSLQLGLLRALAAGPADGRRAGRGPRPVLPRQPRLHAHHAGRPARRRDLPADRRRVPRPAAVQPGLGSRRRGHDQRRPGGQRRDRERRRQRRRRRQARLHLRAGHDRLLPRREAGPAQRRHVPLLARRGTHPRAGPARRAGAQTGGGLGRLRDPVRSQRRRAPAAEGAQGGPRRPARLDRPARRAAVDPATRLYRYTDYWGTAVTAFDLHAPHKELAVVATSVVETADIQAPVATAAWPDLATDEVRDRHTEMLEFTAYVGRDRPGRAGGGATTPRT